MWGPFIPMQAFRPWTCRQVSVSTSATTSQRHQPARPNSWAPTAAAKESSWEMPFEAWGSTAQVSCWAYAADQDCTGNITKKCQCQFICRLMAACISLYTLRCSSSAMGHLVLSSKDSMLCNTCSTTGLRRDACPSHTRHTHAKSTHTSHVHTHTCACVSSQPSQSLYMQGPAGRH